MRHLEKINFMRKLVVEMVQRNGFTVTNREQSPLNLHPVGMVVVRSEFPDIILTVSASLQDLEGNGKVGLSRNVLPKLEEKLMQDFRSALQQKRGQGF